MKSDVLDDCRVSPLTRHSIVRSSGSTWSAVTRYGPIGAKPNARDSALRDDFLEIVTCRGYLSKGPFDSFESMVFPDREGSDLLLEPVIESTMALIDVRPASHCKGFLGKASCTMEAASGATPTSFTLNGAIHLGGRVTLTLREPVTNTRMWTKSVEMPVERVPFTGETVYSALAKPAPPDAWADRGVQAALAPALERAYQAVLTASEGHLNG
jgi:hypothetical protein